MFFCDCNPRSSSTGPRDVLGSVYAVEELCLHHFSWYTTKYFFQNLLGTKTTFMSKEETYQGMGLALLCSVQPYLCCLDKSPQVFLQVSRMVISVVVAQKEMSGAGVGTR
jgi:hypothetical protein